MLRAVLPLLIWVSLASASWISCSGGPAKCISGTPQSLEAMPVNFTVAFIADQSLDSEAISVLQLIKDEGAEMVVHSGDFDYADDPDAWDAQINSVLGEDFPYFSDVGNHELDVWSAYQQKIYDRLVRINTTTCQGEVGVNMVCSYKGLMVVFSGVGTLGSSHEQYIQQSFEAWGGLWRVCSWHKNMHLMQVGTKPDDTGWDVYDICRQQGALIMTGHDHNYARTYLMSDFATQKLAPQNDSDTLVISPGQTVAALSGIAGKPVEECDPTLTSRPWWAATGCLQNNQKQGALFCKFNVNGQADSAECYFKDYTGDINDYFLLRTTNNPVGNGVPKQSALVFWIVTGCVAGVILIVSIVAFFLYTRRKNQQRRRQRASPSPTSSERSSLLLQAEE